MPLRSVATRGVVRSSARLRGVAGFAAARGGAGAPARGARTGRSAGRAAPRRERRRRRRRPARSAPRGAVGCGRRGSVAAVRSEQRGRPSRAPPRRPARRTARAAPGAAPMRTPSARVVTLRLASRLADRAPSAVEPLAREHHTARALPVRARRALRTRCGSRCAALAAREPAARRVHRAAARRPIPPLTPPCSRRALSRSCVALPELVRVAPAARLRGARRASQAASLRVARRGVALEVPLASIARVTPWRLPLPRPACRSRLRVGRVAARAARAARIRRRCSRRSRLAGVATAARRRARARPSFAARARGLAGALVRRPLVQVPALRAAAGRRSSSTRTSTSPTADCSASTT